MSRNVLWLRAVLLLLASGGCFGCSGPRTPGDLRRELWANPSYQKQTRPGWAMAAVGEESSGEPWTARADNITLDLGVLSLSVVSLQTGTFTIELVLVASWIDERLTFKDADAGGCFPPDKGINFDAKTILSEIWAPEPNFDTMALIGPKDGALLGQTVRLRPNGKVEWITKSRRTFNCAFDLSRLPFDTHTCAIAIQSWGPPRSEINYVAGYSYIAQQGGGAVEWRLGGVTSKEHVTFADEAGVTFSLALERRSAYQVINVMLPTTLFVLVAWTSFFIARAAVPARVGMTITSMLITINFQSSVLRSLPPIPGSAYLLTYLRVSIFFALFAILEFAFVNVISRREAKVDGALAALNKKRDEQAAAKAEEAKARGKAAAKAEEATVPARLANNKARDGEPQGQQVDVVAVGEEEQQEEVEVCVVVDDEDATEGARERATAARLAARQAGGRIAAVMVSRKTGAVQLRDQWPDIVSRWLFLPAYALVLIALYPWG